MPGSGEGKTGKLPLGLPYLALSICIFILFRSRKLPSLIYLMIACPPPNSFFLSDNPNIIILGIQNLFPSLIFSFMLFLSLYFCLILWNIISTWFSGTRDFVSPLWTCIPTTFFIPRMWVGMMWCVSFSRGRQRPFPWGLGGQRGHLEGALCSISF